MFRFPEQETLTWRARLNRRKTELQGSRPRLYAPISRPGCREPSTLPLYRPAPGEMHHGMVLDGEIAVPDERGVMHITDLQDGPYRKQFDLSRLRYSGADATKFPL